jgi:hypothetical protein
MSTTSSPSAKSSSLWAQIIAAVWIAGWSAYKFVSNAAAIDMSDVMLSGLAIAACFTPVYFSIIMDKIKDIRFGSAPTDGGGK